LLYLLRYPELMNIQQPKAFTIKRHIPTIASLKKVFLIVIVCVLLFNTAKSQSRDTTYSYYKYMSASNHNLEQVWTANNADLIRVIYPPDQATKSIPVRQFYSDGKISFVGSYDLVYYEKGKQYRLTGDCISFFPNGKRENVAHYTNGRLNGIEYNFYENGKVYWSKKHAISKDGYSSDMTYWDFFNTVGSQLCREGNGEWVDYDASFKPIIQGFVKNGLKDGRWHGKTNQADSISYVFVYKNGKFVSGEGSRLGKIYPFKWEIEHSSITESWLKFIEKVRKNFKGANANYIKMAELDTARIRFVVGVDGKLSDAEIVGNNDPALREILQNALNKCTGETPVKYYGVPIRTKITMGFKDDFKETESRSSSINTTQSLQITGEGFAPSTMSMTESTYTHTSRSIYIAEEILPLE
jgi:antitoxin component YwqK of YwqJK toxin-antitoxin module